MPGTLLQPKIQQVGGQLIMFLSYYWEIHEDGKRAEWGYDSVQIGLPLDRPPDIKQVEGLIAEEEELDKVVIMCVQQMGITGGIPAIIGGKIN